MANLDHLFAHVDPGLILEFCVQYLEKMLSRNNTKWQAESMPKLVRDLCVNKYEEEKKRKSLAFQLS